MNKILGGLTALGVAALLVGAPAAAFADDAPVTPTDMPSAASAPADTSTVPVASTDAAPVAPAPDPAPVPIVSAVAALTVTVAPVVVTPPADPYVAVLWQTDVAGQKYGQHIVTIRHEATKTLIDLPTTCGASFQSDVYLESAGLEALLDNGNGKLAGPDGAQDGNFLAPGGTGVAYEYVDNATCPPPPPVGVACHLTGTDYTEDVDWTQTAAGKSLTGQTSAVDHYYGVTGNLQGLTALKITETTTSASGQSALAVIEVNPHGPAYTGGPAITYETLSPVGPNSDGVTDELAGTFYSSKIPYATAGGQGSPEPLSWFISAQPNNTLISIGVHFQTHGDGTSVVTALDGGCFTESYPYPTVTLPGASYTPATCDAPASVTLPDATEGTTKYTLNADGTRPAGGTYALPVGSGVDLTGPFTLHTLASAPVQPASVTFGPFTPADAIPAQNTNPDAPCYTLFTGASASVYVSAAATCGVLGVATDSETNATLDAALDETAGAHTASFTAAPGFEFGTGETASTTLTVDYTIADATVCPVVSHPKVLGFTGDSPAQVAAYWRTLALGGGLVLLALVMIIAGAITVRRRNAQS